MFTVCPQIVRALKSLLSLKRTPLCSVKLGLSSSVSVCHMSEGLMACLNPLRVGHKPRLSRAIRRRWHS